MPSLRALTVLLVVLVLVPAAALAWLGWRGAAAGEDAFQARLDAELADGRAALRRALDEEGRRLEAEVEDRLAALAETARRVLPARGVAEGMMAVVASAPPGDAPPLYDLRLLDRDGRQRWPVLHDPDAPASDALSDRLRFDLLRQGDRRQAAEGSEAARAFWADVADRAPDPCFAAWARGRAALLPEAGERQGPLARLRALEAGLDSRGRDCAARPRALLLLQAARRKEAEAGALLRERWTSGEIAQTPLTRVERELAAAHAGRGAEAAWPVPWLVPATAPWGPPAPTVDVTVALPAGARLEARLRAREVQQVLARRLNARSFAPVRATAAPGTLDLTRSSTPDPTGSPPASSRGSLARLRAAPAYDLPVDVLFHHADAEAFERGRHLRRALTIGGVAALLLLMGVGLVLVRQALLREREAGRLRDAFVANVSHELRTPLSSVLLHADLLAEPGVDTAKRERLATVVRDEGRRLGALVEDLLDFASLASGRRRLEVEPVDVAAALSRALLPYEVPAEQEGVRLEIETPEGEEAVLADPHALGRILANLLSNAWRHGRPSGDGAPGRITALVRPLSALETVVEVSDDGPGIPPEEREAVFERFRRGARAGDRGVGLGLALSRDLARAMEGDLELVSSEGRTTFRLRLPSFPPSPAPEEGA